MSVKYGILTLLYFNKSYGYELKLGLEDLLGFKGKINPGQIYTTLDRLVRDQLVSSSDIENEERELFELTIKGEEELTKWLLTPVPYHTTKEDFFFKWSCARKINFDLEKKMLEQQKNLIIKEIMELTKIKMDFLIQENEEKYLLISGILFHLEADLNWIRQVEARIPPT